MKITGNFALKPKNITVVLLAAGYGKRMRPLTEHTPKPLLKIGKHSLIEHHLIRLAKQGFKEIVINIAHLAEQFEPALGDGSNYGVNITYSDESKCGALETAGGLANAIPLINSDPFITVNADIWTDFDFRQLLEQPPQYAKLVMVSNPEHNPTGDFAMNPDEKLQEKSDGTSTALTYSGIAIYQKSVFKELPISKQALAPIFRQLIRKKHLDGLKLTGIWHDVGTPARLEEIQRNVDCKYNHHP